tara:strand:- start:664 stop:852 length:189 start_codon:yes stop_codon:yes gene_type:complete
LNPSSDETERSRNEKIGKLKKNMITPDILCEMEEIAVIGNWIVKRFKLTGGLDIYSLVGSEL